MRIADYSVTRAILERHGFTFKKSFGHNFLTDTNILQKIVDTVEIDDRLVPILADTLRDFDNVTVINEDILQSDLQTCIKNFKNPDLPIKVVPNICPTTS